MDGGNFVGQAIGGYRVIARVGRGGIGEVYVGVHPTLGKRVAIKVLREEVARDEDMRRRFFDEARAAAALDSPHIVEVLDLAQLADGTSYMTMEFLEGESLAQMIARVGALAPGVAVAVAAQALAGLAEAHAEGIVHRDLKPANLFVARTRRGPLVKVLDFGLVKLTGRMQAGGATQTGTILGTPEYMAPEQASTSSGAIDARTDVYAFGVILYEMLTGRPPFQSDNFGKLLVMHQSETPAALAGEVGAVVARALSKAPGQRHAGAAELRAALLTAWGGELPALPEPELAVDLEALGAPRPSARVVSSGPTAFGSTVGAAPASVAPASVAPAEPRGRVLLPMAAGALVMAAAAAIWLWRRHEPRPEPAPAPAQPAPVASVTAPPAADAAQTCQLTLIDERGGEHRYGGKRVRGAATSLDEVNIAVSGGAPGQLLQIHCTPIYGESAYVFLIVQIPAAALAPGSHPLPDGALKVNFSGLVPDGFVAKNYDGAGRLDLTAFEGKAGTWMRGSVTAEPSSGSNRIKLDVRFDFKL